jgi:hypothetical protein
MEGQDLILSKDQIEQNRANIIFNSFGVDVINSILKYLSLRSSYDICNNSQCKCTTRWVLHSSEFFRMRLVCTKWDRAAKMCMSQWIKLLETHGPKQITKNSIHRKRMDRNVCKISSVTGICNIASHYQYNQLSAKYNNKNDSISFYKEAIKHMAKKFKKTQISTQNRIQKKLEVNKKRLERYQLYVSEQEVDLKNLEKNIELSNEHYQSFLKRTKPVKSVKRAKIENVTK